MHDTFLFANIADSLLEIAKNNHITQFTYIEVNVHQDSHVDAVTLLNHLHEYIPYLIENQVVIKVNRGKEQPLHATIKKVEGLSEDEDKSQTL